MARAPESSKTRLLGATIDLVRSNGYAATRVEDVCSAAGVTKGSFFHHFASKEQLAIEAARTWGKNSEALFDAAPFMARKDPLDRLLGYIRFRRELIAGEMFQWTCYAGTTVQEVHETHPQLRDACADSIEAHLQQLVAMIEPVLAVLPVNGVTATSLALHMQAVIQGAFVMAKARQDSQVAIASIDHLYRYVEMLFCRSTTRKRLR